MTPPFLPWALHTFALSTLPTGYPGSSQGVVTHWFGVFSTHLDHGTIIYGQILRTIIQNYSSKAENTHTPRMGGVLGRTEGKGGAAEDDMGR